MSHGELRTWVLYNLALKQYVNNKNPYLVKKTLVDDF